MKVPCECMGDPAELLRSEFPGWSVEVSTETSWWMWKGDGPKPGTSLRVLLNGDGVYSGLGDDPPQCKAPDLLTAAEHATGETRLSRRPKPETGTARIVSWAEDIREDDNRPRPLAPSAEALRAKGAAEVKERDFHKLTAILEKHTADLRAAFPDRTWSFSVGMDLAASCIYENEFGDAPSYIQWRNGWFAGTEDGPETKTYTTPVDAFRALTGGDVKRMDEKPHPAPDFHAIASALADTLTAKNAAYGNSFAVTGDFLRLLWPNGCKPGDFDRVMLCARMFDKMKRLATAKTGDDEDPLLDLAGYAVLGLATRGVR